MPLNTILAAWDTWLGAQAAPLSTPVRYRHAPPWPYSGTWPFIIIIPHSQHRYRYSNAEVYYAGYWRLLYCDLVGSTYTSTDLLLEAAASWADLLVTTLQANETNRSLSGAVDYVGEGPESGEGGIMIAFDDKQSFLNPDQIPAWALPVDIHVRGLPEPG